jgi:hypothetical protein
MVHVVKLELVEQIGEQGMIRHRPLDKNRPSGDVILKPTAQIVQYHHFVAHAQTVLCYVGTDEAGPASYEGSSHDN